MMREKVIWLSGGKGNSKYLEGSMNTKEGRMGKMQ
jgi:hypothetical protein